MDRAKRILKSNESIMAMLLIAIVVVFGCINPKFFRLVNLVQYLKSGVVLGFLAIALSATIITGNYDYSIGAMCGFGTVIIAQFMVMGMPLALALICAFLALVVIGAINGFVVGYLRIPGMIGTLGTSSLIYGFALVLTGGQAIGVGTLPDAEAYMFFGKSDMGTLPFGMVMLAAIFVIALIMLNYTRWGRRLYLIGSNAQVARFTGVNYAKDVMLVHIFSAVMCFFGALVLGSTMASGRADVGDPYVLKAVTAAVLGGISIKGGEGRISGTLLGVMIFSLLESGFTMIGLTQYYTQVATGFLLIVVLLFRNYKDIFRKN